MSVKIGGDCKHGVYLGTGCQECKAEREAKAGSELSRPPGSVDGLVNTIKEIKKIALETTSARHGLARIIRLCIDAEKATGTWVRIDERNPSPPNTEATDRPKTKPESP